MEIIDSGQAVAKQTKAILEKRNLLNDNKPLGNHQFYINKSKKILDQIIPKQNQIKIEEKYF
jgi:glutamate racemase